MRFALLLVFLLLFACGQKKTTDSAASIQAMDSSGSLTDTVKEPFRLRDQQTDSLANQRERDSFFAIPPLRQLVSDSPYGYWNQLTALFLDTGFNVINQIPVQATVKTHYNKEQLPVSEDRFFTAGDFKLQIHTDCFEEYCPRQFYISNKKLVIGRDIDTTISGDWMLDNIGLDAERFEQVQIGPRHFLLARGSVMKCNGNACGIVYFFLYDLVSKRVILYSQYRDDQFRAGYNPQTGNVELLISRDVDYIDPWDCATHGGDVYTLSPAGKTAKKKGRNGQPVYYEGYRRFSDEYRLNIMAGNFK